MCSLHSRVAKKYGAQFDEVRAELTTDASDDTIYRLKVAKQRAIDECMMLTGCASVERYLKVLQSPTPQKRMLQALQNHVDELIKIVR